MKQLLLLCLISLPLLAAAQGIGLKAGINFANVSNASDIGSSSHSGFVAGVFLAPPSSRIISSVTEINFSRQGYSYSNGTTTGNVSLDYIVIPQFMAINITKLFQIQVGMQMAFLLNAKADSSKAGGPAGSYGGIMDMYNKFDYGFGAGLQVRPVAGLLVGARYNLSLGKLYKEAMTGQMPSFSSADAKNNLVQLYAGWVFGSGKNKKH
jgi:hypothetical protein